MDHRHFESLHVHLFPIRHQRHPQNSQGKGQDFYHLIHSLRHSILLGSASDPIHQHFHR